MLDLPVRGKIGFFADDTALIYGGYTQTMVLENYYTDIRILSFWFHENRLQLNAEKCCFINFGFKKLNSTESLKIHKYTCTSDGVCDCPDMQKQMKTKVSWSNFGR